MRRWECFYGWAIAFPCAHSEHTHTATERESEWRICIIVHLVTLESNFYRSFCVCVFVCATVRERSLISYLYSYNFLSFCPIRKRAMKLNSEIMMRHRGRLFFCSLAPPPSMAMCQSVRMLILIDSTLGQHTHTAYSSNGFSASPTHHRISILRTWVLVILSAPHTVEEYTHTPPQSAWMSHRTRIVVCVKGAQFSQLVCQRPRWAFRSQSHEHKIP